MASLLNRSAVANISGPDKITAVRAGPNPPGFREAAKSAAEALDLRSFLNILKRRREVILGCAVLLVGLSAIIIFQLTPIYTAEAVVMLDTRKSQVVDLQAVMSGIQSDEAAVRSEVEVLKSRSLAARVVDKLELTSNPQLNPELQPATFWQEVSPLAPPPAAIFIANEAHRG